MSSAFNITWGKRDAQGWTPVCSYFSGRIVVHNPPLYLFCSSANFLFICVCTMFSFISSPAKTSTSSGGGSGSPHQDVSNMSPEQMRALRAQQQAALASLQTNLDDSA